jgi:hypothetical protein
MACAFLRRHSTAVSRIVRKSKAPAVTRGKLEVVGVASARIGGHALQLVSAVGAGLQVARVVRSHDQAVTFSDGEDGEESTAPAKTMGIIYDLSLPADETV